MDVMQELLAEVVPCALWKVKIALVALVCIWVTKDDKIAVLQHASSVRAIVCNIQGTEGFEATNLGISLRYSIIPCIFHLGQVIQVAICRRCLI